MKRIYIIIALLLVSKTYVAQDLIVTNSGDSINCKITKIKKDNAYFTFKHKNEIRNTFLPLSKVSHHQFAFYTSREVPLKKVLVYGQFPYFRLALNGGYSYHIARVSDDVPDALKGYTERLKSGYHIGGDVSYYPIEYLGFGLKYHQFKSKNSMKNYELEISFGDNIVGDISNELTISFIGPSFSSRLLNHKKSDAFFTTLSLGYLSYINDESFFNNKYRVTGKAIGVAFDIGYDIGVVGNLAIGFQASFLVGVLTNLELKYGQYREKIDLEPGEYESLSRIDLSIGIRFVK